MRIQRIIARTMAKKKWTLEKKMENQKILQNLFNHAYSSGVRGTLESLEQSTAHMSYDVEVGGVHG